MSQADREPNQLEWTPPSRPSFRRARLAKEARATELAAAWAAKEAAWAAKEAAGRARIEGRP